MIAGAALQKDSQALRDSIRGNVKVSCFTCGAFYYTTAAQIRSGTHPCRCGAGPMLTANLLACSQLEPERLEEHPDLEDAEAQARRQELAGVRKDERATYHGGSNRATSTMRNRDACQECGRRRPAHTDPDYWYCRPCGTIMDGDGSFKASPFSTEVEAAHGRARQAPERIVVQVGAHRERVAPIAENPDIPF